MDRRGFLRTSCGMAAAFVAMNEVLWSVCSASIAPKPRSPKPPPRGRTVLPEQFIFDDQLHFVRDDYKCRRTLPDLAKYAAAHWNPSMQKDPVGPRLDRYKFDNFLKEIYSRQRHAGSAC